MSNIDLVAKYVGENDLCNIPVDTQIQIGRRVNGVRLSLLLLLITVEVSVWEYPGEPGGRNDARRGQTFELLADVRHLLVYSLLF